MIVYHARNYTELIGNPLWEPNRHACAQVLPFVDGEPQWGEPQPLSRPVPAGVEVLAADGTAR